MFVESSDLGNDPRCTQNPKNLPMFIAMVPGHQVVTKGSEAAFEHIWLSGSTTRSADVVAINGDVPDGAVVSRFRISDKFQCDFPPGLSGI
jgi:hypothetical protein